MEKIIIKGGKKLTGEIKISGAKNAALPILIATLLSDEESIISNVPLLRDTKTILQLLAELGMNFTQDQHTVSLQPAKKLNFEAPYELVKTMRASFLVSGPLLARLHQVKVALPGGCAIGIRPVDLHLKGFQKLGAKIEIKKGYVNLTARQLRGAPIKLTFPSVGATENLLMAAVLAEGTTTIFNAAREPEVADLARFLQKMGAKIKGIGSDKLQIQGVKKLSGPKYSVIPDRIETGTYLVAGAITGGNIILKNIRARNLTVVIKKLRQMGSEITETNNAVKITRTGELKPISICTQPYPGFPTDMQAQFMALSAITPGESRITETIFENRFMHVGELQRMGANIHINDAVAVINGVSKLSGAQVMATDLRASAALVLAGLVARGQTEISRIYHLERGYENLVEKLVSLGAEIQRIKSQTLIDTNGIREYSRKRLAKIGV